MKKILFIASCLLFGLLCHAQDAEYYYMNKCKIYQLPNVDGWIYTASIYSSQESIYSERVKANNISLFSGSQFLNYSTSHGQYIEFSHSHKVTGGYSSARHMLFSAYRYGLCAITEDGNCLRVIRLEDDTVLLTLDANFQEGDDFMVLVRDDDNVYGNRAEPSIWVVNNGCMKVFNNLSNHVASVRSARADKASNKSYTLGGIEVASPDNGIYIQNGKKIAINK